MKITNQTKDEYLGDVALGKRGKILIEERRLMVILKAPIAGKEKEVEKVFQKAAEGECPGVKLSVRFRKEYDGYNIQLEKAGVKRDLFFHEMRLTDDDEESKLIEAVKYEAQSLQKDTKYKDTLELARGKP